MNAGIIGVPYVGKTTLFTALTALGPGRHGAARPNIGVLQVPDPRLAVINRFIPTRKVVPATCQLVDLAGLVSAAGRQVGSGNRVLAQIRDVDALIHVVRCFENPDLPHVAGSIDPVRDVDAVETDLILTDLEQLEGMQRKAAKQARTGDKTAQLRLKIIETCCQGLSEGKPVSALDVGALASPDGASVLRSLALLTAKPVLYVANVGDGDLDGQNDFASQLRHLVEQRGSLMVALCAQLESELVELPDQERLEMCAGLGLAEPALNRLARAAYQLLRLHSFFTAGPKEVRAWPVPVGTTAPEAAGTIHGDMQRGFIRAEVYSVQDLAAHESEQALRAAGKMRVEGKSYVMQEGDVCHFLFNV